jgi:uncharacterized protein YcaQ
VHRHFPDLISQARNIQESEARRELLRLYLASVGAARVADLSKLFRWQSFQLLSTLDELEKSRWLKSGLSVAGETGDWIAIPEVL